jgi:hypothetical protein
MKRTGEHISTRRTRWRIERSGGRREEETQPETKRGRQRVTERDSLRQRETERHRDTETQRHKEPRRHTERHRDTETQRHRDTETQRHRDTETQRHRETEVWERESISGYSNPSARVQVANKRTRVVEKKKEHE